MKNSLALRIAGFLKNHLPFSKLSDSDNFQIAEDIRVVSLEKNQTLFKINDLLHDSFYVVASGVVNLMIVSDAEEKLLNKCVSGDMFGLRPFFAKNNYMMTAKAREDSVVYAIPIASFRPFLSQNSEVLNFLLESFAANSKHPGVHENSGNYSSEAVNFPDKQPEIQYFQALNYNKMPLLSSSAALVKDLAQLMTDNLSDSAIVVLNKLPIGIVTDADLRTKIATGRYPVSIAVDRVMSTPVLTVPENVSLAEAQLLLLKNNLTHLVVTADGSDKSEVKGIISQNDLIVAQASNPGVLIKEIKRSKNGSELFQVREKLSDLVRTSIAKNIPLPHVNNISGEIITAMVKRAVELAILEMGSPPSRFAYFSIGSQGRKEQLLMTDHDSMLVFDDVSPDKYQEVRDYFLRLAKRTVFVLEQSGFPPCPKGHLASNVQWCKSLSEWKKQFADWIQNPGAKDSGIDPVFFDFDLIVGETRIEEDLLELVYGTARKNSFFDYLGNLSLRKPPPLTFFKKFNVEEEGENRDKFDIVTRAIAPLTDAARLLALSQNLRGVTNTYMRFKQLAMLDLRNSETYLNSAESWVILSKYRTLEGMKFDNSGQFLNLQELSRIDKDKIKAAIEPMKDLEELIKDKFRLTQFS